MSGNESLIRVENLQKHYNKGAIKALDGINTEITQGASEGMVVVTEATIGNMPGGNVSPEGGQEGGGEQSPFMPSHPGSKKKGK